MLMAKNGITILVVILGAAAWASAGDESDIKDAATAFGTALSRGDAAAARKVATSDDTTVAFIDNAAPMIGASNKLSDAATNKFGEQGKSVSIFGGIAANLSNMTRLASDSQVKITGDTATIEPPKNPNADAGGARAARGRSPQPLHFKKDGGKWKVDLSSSSATRVDAANFHAMTQALNDTADEIKAGKYATADEARQALVMKIATGVRGGRGQ